MTEQKPTPVDYLVVGHVTKDLTPEGPLLGGSTAYAGRTALAFDLRVGMLTSSAGDIDLEPLKEISILSLPTEQSTTFENLYTAEGRTQNIYAMATRLGPQDVPAIWHDTPIVHLAPIATEIETSIIKYFGDTFLCMTPQGWLRRWDANGTIYLNDWHELIHLLPAAKAVVISMEDLGGDAHASREMAAHCEILAVTAGAEGVRVFVGDQERLIPAPQVDQIDPTGAGDIFASAFFIKVHQTKDPWEAARIASALAAYSVTRRGLASTPSPEEVEKAQAWVLR
jgi:sugar/nucleoside kinase (ribokinase family)